MPTSCCLPCAKPAGSNSQCSQSLRTDFANAIDSHSLSKTQTVCIQGAWFAMGASDGIYPQDGEGPSRQVWVDTFNLATTAVSTLEFHQFVQATNYQTEAERTGSSFVFHLLIDKHENYPASGLAPWWRAVAGACWKNPEGVGSSIEDRLDHPVVHITRQDALRYCQWSGTRLPTEAQWECAARGGLLAREYPWGNDLLIDGKHCCNIWQGDFPHTNTCDDGYAGTAPVDAYDVNAFGLYNMIGNVWEWVEDRFTNMHSARPTRNPKGPLNGEQYVAKGGSYLCHESYCKRYRNSSRQALAENVSAGNLGFRVALL